MSRFRHRPSHRKAAKPTASWLVLGPTEASAVRYDRRTLAVIPCKSSDHTRRYYEGQSLAVKAYVGGANECRVLISTVDRVPLGEIDYVTIRRLDYIRLDVFQATWVEQHDTNWLAKQGDDIGIDTLLDRFQARHAHKPVWRLEFKLDRLKPVRFLAQRSEELYTDSPHRALQDEMPALYDDEWERHIDANKDLDHGQWLAKERATRLDQHRRLPKHLRKAA